MLTSLGIRNYRGFESLDIERLGRINLIAGKNNSGKTSLLEAIFLLSGGGRADLAGHPAILRTKSPAENASGATVLDRWSWMFFEGDTGSRIKICGKYSKIGVTELEISRKSRTEIQLTSNDIDIMADPNRQTFSELLFSYTAQNTEKEIQSYAHVNENKIHVKNSKDAQTVVSFAYIDARNSNPVSEAEHLGDLRRHGQDAPVLEALRAVEPDIRSVEANPGFGVSTILVDIGLRELVPLAVMGEGMNRLALMTIFLCGLSDGILLVDEVEAGLHHSALPKVWKALEKIAVARDLQIVATTHSYECIEAAHKALDPANLLLHRLEAGNRGNRCVTDDAESIETALHYNMEVR